SRLRSARSTQVLPTPGSPRSKTLSRSASASSMSATSSALLSGSQRSVSSISFENGAVRKPKAARSEDVLIVVLLSSEGATRVEVDGVPGPRGGFAQRGSRLLRVADRVDDPKRVGL